MGRVATDTADYLEVALADLAFVADATRDGTLTAPAMLAAARTFTSAAAKLRREAEEANSLPFTPPA